MMSSCSSTVLCTHVAETLRPQYLICLFTRMQFQARGEKPMLLIIFCSQNSYYARELHNSKFIATLNRDTVSRENGDPLKWGPRVPILGGPQLRTNNCEGSGLVDSARFLGNADSAHILTQRRMSPRVAVYSIARS